MTRLRDVLPMAINRLWAGYLVIALVAFALVSMAGTGLQTGTGAVLGLAGAASVLLVSGYAEEIVEGGRDDSVPFLAKPFSAESLLAAVDAAMGSAELGGAGSGSPYSSEPPGFLVESGPRP